MIVSEFKNFKNFIEIFIKAGSRKTWNGMEWNGIFSMEDKKYGMEYLKILNGILKPWNGISKNMEHIQN